MIFWSRHLFSGKWSHTTRIFAFSPALYQGMECCFNSDSPLWSSGRVIFSVGAAMDVASVLASVSRGAKRFSRSLALKFEDFSVKVLHLFTFLYECFQRCWVVFIIFSENFDLWTIRTFYLFLKPFWFLVIIKSRKKLRKSFTFYPEAVRLECLKSLLLSCFLSKKWMLKELLCFRLSKSGCSCNFMQLECSIRSSSFCWR